MSNFTRITPHCGQSKCRIPLFAPHLLLFMQNPIAKRQRVAENPLPHETPLTRPDAE